MSYLGKTQFKSSDVQRFDVTSSTSATHALSWTAPNEQSLIVTINGVKQQDDAYSIAGSPTTVTLTDALITTDKLEIVGIVGVGTMNVPGVGSVQTELLADDAVTADKLANSINTEIAANTAKVTNATHTGDVTGATALTIAADAVDIAMLSATGTADATTFLRGDNAWASAGGDNTPSFSGTLASDTSITTATWTCLPFDTAEWDTDSALDITTNKGRFTVPAGEGGKYVFHGGAGGFTGGDGWELMRLALYKNGAFQTDGGHGYLIEVIPYGGTGWDTFLTLSATMLLSAADYVELYVYQNLSTSNTVTGVTYFSGFKLVGV